jgi:hypothetical protein
VGKLESSQLEENNMNTKWYAPILAFGLFFLVGELKSNSTTMFDVVFSYFMAFGTTGIIVYLALKYNKWSKLFLFILLPVILLVSGSISLLQCIALSSFLFSILATISILKE